MLSEAVFDKIMSFSFYRIYFEKDENPNIECVHSVTNSVIFRVYPGSKTIWASRKLLWEPFTNYTNTIREVRNFLETQISNQVNVIGYELYLPSWVLNNHPQKKIDN